MNKLPFHLIGLVLGLLSIPGWLDDLEFMVWIALCLFTGLVYYQSEVNNSFRLSLTFGFSWAFGYALIKTLFFSNYIDANPEYIASLEGLPDSIRALWVPMITMPVMALVLSLLIWLSFQLMRWLR